MYSLRGSLRHSSGSGKYTFAYIEARDSNLGVRNLMVSEAMWVVEIA